MRVNAEIETLWPEIDVVPSDPVEGLLYLKEGMDSQGGVLTRSQVAWELAERQRLWDEGKLSDENAFSFGSVHFAILAGDGYDPRTAGRLKKAGEILRTEELKRLIDEGYATYGMIKPRLDLGMLDGVMAGMSDVERARRMEEMVEERGMKVLLRVSVNWSRSDAEAFYGDEHRHQVFFEDLISYMSSGPVDMLLLLSPEPDAVNRWREMIGPTDPDRAREISPDSFRTMARDRATNLIHGADSIASAKREIGVMADIILRLFDPEYLAALWRPRERNTQN